MISCVMKKFFFGIVSISFCLMFCNCQSKEINCVSQTNVNSEIPSNYKMDEGRVVFDCEIIAPPNPHLYTCTAQELDVDQIGFVNYLLGDEEVYKTTVCTDEPIVIDGKKKVSKTEVDTNLYRYDFGDNKGLTFGTVKDTRYMSLYSQGNIIEEALLLGEEDEGYNGDLYMNKEDFVFASKNDVIQNLKSMISSYCNITELREDVYYVDAETMNHNNIYHDLKEDELNGRSKTPYTQDDDGYYICMRQELQGIPVFPGGAGPQMMDYKGNTPIVAYYTKDGWKYLYFSLSELYCFNEGNEELILKKFDEITDVVTSYYNELITDHKFEVYRATLYNYVSKKGDVIPLWIFKIYEKYPDGNFRCDQLNINAVTGEILTIYD